MIERAERQALEKLVATMVERAIAKALAEQPSPGESDIAALNQQKRLELLDRVIRLEERSIRLDERTIRLEERSIRLEKRTIHLEKRTIRLEEGQKHLQEGQKQLQEGQKALIQEIGRRFTEMREDSGRRFQFVQWLIVAVGSFLTLVMTLLHFF